MIFLLIAVFIGLILYEVPGLIRNKYWRELAAFSILISIAFGISLLQTLKIEIPNPIRDTQYLVKNLLHLSYD
jgi:putative effector of murein hydrolase